MLVLYRRHVVPYMWAGIKAAPTKGRVVIRYLVWIETSLMHR
ncbi:MAG: hypothetical protein R3Y26_08165 [Rikenellaceae bacterium]